MKNKIYILSEPIRSGKTSLLLNWTKNQADIGGILTPDIDGMRKLLDIETGCYYHFQLPNHANGIKIGRFVFDAQVFAIARQIILSAFNKPYKWFVVDEIGQLEIDSQSGLEPAIGWLISEFKNHPQSTRLMLVIRDFLLSKALKYYGISHFEILDRKFFS